MDVRFDLSRFEPVNGQKPFRVLDRHRSGRAIALQYGGGSDNAAGIWDYEAGKLLGAGETALPIYTSGSTVPALCWSADGRQVILLRDQYHYQPELHHIIGSPLQSEYTHYLERWSWPDLEQVAVCTIQPPTGWMETIAVSPDGDLAAFTWCDQDGTGFELVRLSSDGDEQLPAATCQRQYELIYELAFSPDGRYLVLTGTGWEIQWWTDGGDRLGMPSEGGRREAGFVAVFDLGKRTLKEQRIVIDVPAGWLPSNENATAFYTPGQPRFINSAEFAVPLQTGEERLFSIGLYPA
ncbi:MAG: hypothetical protein OJF49_000243 [Ktedonobacterales bacterium]|nr:MAG: hypothetical protein OJF49_000243 [Ktedonobacterales bacterium]